MTPRLDTSTLSHFCIAVAIIFATAAGGQTEARDNEHPTNRTATRPTESDILVECHLIRGPDLFHALHLPEERARKDGLYVVGYARNMSGLMAYARIRIDVRWPTMTRSSEVSVSLIPPRGNYCELFVSRLNGDAGASVNLETASIQTKVLHVTYK